MNIQDKFWKVASLVGIILAIFLVIISIKELKSISYVGKTDQFNVITVNGSGYAYANPNIAMFTFTVSEKAKTVELAQDTASKHINTVIKSLEDSGIEKKYIKTTSYNISPNYEYTQNPCVSGMCPVGKSELTGYDVSQNIEVKVKDISKVGKLFTDIGSLGVTNVSSLSFTVEDMTAVKSEARKIAIEEAEKKAEELAKSLGVSLVRVTGFYDSSDYGSPMVYGMGGDVRMEKVSTSATVPSIPSGEQKVVSTVTVTYEIR